MSNLTVVDLFSGPGGFSEGFRQEGYHVAAGVDYDENSVETFNKNHPESAAIQGDVSEIDPEYILQEGGVSKEDVNIVVGGPPCQGFSIAGDRNEGDERNQLFKDFASKIAVLEPEYFIMENVTGLLSMETPEGRPVIDEIQDQFEDLGYTTKYRTLVASDYGAPQNRKRVFILGTNQLEPLSFPTPTHSGEGQTTLGQNGVTLDPYVTVADAFSDLPQLDAGETATDYKKPPQNDFQTHMRRKMNENSTIPNHDAVNHRDHIVERFRHIPQGGDMTDAPEEHQPSKVYSSRNRRLPEDRPSYTVTSHVLDELIHPWDDRAVTVREAARLQCFPDHYEFHGKRNVFHGSDETSQYEQVGNAVPVALSQSLAAHLKDSYFKED